MDIKASRKETRIILGEAYCYNYDKIIDACVYLAAKEYWEVGGGKSQMDMYRDNVLVYRDYKRIKFALRRFEGMSEEEIFDGIAYGMGQDNWNFGSFRNVYRYNKTIETLFELRGYMWN